MSSKEIATAFAEVRRGFPFPRYMDSKLSRYVAIASQIMERVRPGSTILSIGSGPCDLEAILSKLGYSVTGVDDLRDQWHLMGKNRERIKHFAKMMNVELVIESAGSSPLQKNHFNAVLLIDIIEHLHTSPRELLNYAISCLKSGGVLLIETPNSVALSKRLKVLFGKTNHVDIEFFYWTIGEYRSHVREYTRAELRQILLHHNLIEIGSKVTNSQTKLIQTERLSGKVTIKIYELICTLSPNFRDTILIWGTKPKNWLPTNYSINAWEKHYPLMPRYNLDNESAEVLVNKLLQQ
jgi:2-polyprenyl-3-methyl-5-hydroxy-6-metoxy-1,4-benzoquinol methylase